MVKKKKKKSLEERQIFQITILFGLCWLFNKIQNLAAVSIEHKYKEAF
jgi:hypothetical protein